MKMKKFYNFLRETYQFLNGDKAYKTYISLHNKNNKNCQNKILSKKEFLQNQQLQKYKTINRCC
jgi:uncharacterized short protein YbdD (DUF466 family)